MAILSPPRYEPPKDLLRVRLYHITSWRNLQGIVQENGLWSTSQLHVKGIKPLSAAHEHIQKRRAGINVKIGPGGTLHDYVAWSFGQRQPMLCALAHNQVVGQQVKQSEMIHLITSLGRVQDAELNEGLQWVFSDGHPTVFNSSFFNSVESFHQVDWDLMKEKWWNNTDEDGDRTRRRQAEFLIHDFVPWSLIAGIATQNEEVKGHVLEIVNGLLNAPEIKVMKGWYF